MKTPINESVKSISLFLVLLFSISITAQNFKTYSGTIVDSKNKTPLHLATLNVENSNISTITNTEGEFSLKITTDNNLENVIVTYLGYQNLVVPIKDLKLKNNKLKLVSTNTELDVVEVNRPQNAKDLVLNSLKLKGKNYLNNDAVMTTFYRETIKKRNKNASLSEAVLKIKKEPYSSLRQDQISIVKARKNTNYSRLDTLAFKLQGGPFSALHTDIIKYQDYIFSEDNLVHYDFKFEKSTEINNKLIYVVGFKQNSGVSELMYYGKLFIDASTNALVKAIYSLNLEDDDKASKIFVKRKPNGAKVLPTKANYLVNYSSKDGKWYYAYSNIDLEFKVKWKSDWFSKRYSLQSEMAVTNWEFNNTFKVARADRLRTSSILQEKASGFSDPNFWGEYNIIEPEKSIESAIKKISKQLQKV